MGDFPNECYSLTVLSNSEGDFWMDVNCNLACNWSESAVEVYYSAGKCFLEGFLKQEAYLFSSHFPQLKLNVLISSSRVQSSWGHWLPYFCCFWDQLSRKCFSKVFCPEIFRVNVVILRMNKNECIKGAFKNNVSK